MAVGKKAWTKNSHPIMRERNSKFRDYQAMTKLGVPDIVVLELVDVDFELTVRVKVHVSNEEMCDKPSKPPSFEYSRDCILFGT